LNLVDSAAAYFSAAQILAVIATIYAAVGALFIAFKASNDSPMLRSKILLVIFGLTSASWIFVASSLAFCWAFEDLYYWHEASAITMILGSSLLTTLVVGLPVSVLMATRLPAFLIRRAEKELQSPLKSSTDLMRALVKSLGLSSVTLFLSPKTIPFAYSMGSSKGVVVISRGLEEELDKEEMETVLMHELAHLRNNDTQLNTLITVYRRVLFFDPLIRVLEGVIHREREFACDEVSARATRKPMALASALIKIHSKAMGSRVPGAFLAGNIALRGDGTLRERIDRLIRISKEIARE